MTQVASTCAVLLWCHSDCQLLPSTIMMFVDFQCNCSSLGSLTLLASSCGSACWPLLKMFMLELLPSAVPALWAGYTVFSSPQSLILHVCFVNCKSIGLPLMLLPSCWTDVPPPNLPVALNAHLLRADPHISEEVPELQHTLRLPCYGVTGAHTVA